MTPRIVAYLISLAVGYWVLTLAAKEKGKNKTIGCVIGWIIIVASIIGPLCIGICHLKCQSGSGYSAACPWNGNSNQSPMMGGKGMMEDKDKAK